MRKNVEKTIGKGLRIRKFIGWYSIAAWVATLFCSQPGMAQEKPEEAQHLEDVVVTEESGGALGIVKTPTETKIQVDGFTTVGVPATVDDILKRQAIVDFRGDSNLVPDDDSITLRGFDSNRFVMAIDSLTIQKTGGRKSSHIVDFALLPTFLIDRIEILPGPHSALYDAKSIGGVINLVTRRPKRLETLKPDVRLTASYGSYNTQTHNALVQGSVENFTYDLAYQKNRTDGYLRNQEADIDTVFGRVGYWLPADGLITLSGSYTWADREIPVDNPGTTLDGDEDFDGDFPRFDDDWLDLQPWQEPTWDKEAHQFRLLVEQPSPIGRLSLGAYTGKEYRDRAWYVLEDDEILYSSSKTDWWQHGGKLQDDIAWNEKHLSTVGLDLVQMYDDGIGIKDEKTKRIEKIGAYLQHLWTVFPSLDLRLGMRYETVTIWVDNWGNGFTWIPGREPKIEREFDEMIPKSFITWRMDDVAPWLRETSLSAGVSKIWRAPDYHGDYNPQGRPAGAWLDPEYGMGYDLVLVRRLWGDIGLKANYSYYEIKDFIATNSSFANFSSPRFGELAFSDYKINLEEMVRNGLELELTGHITDKLSFYLSYAWQDFDSKGGEPAGETAQDAQAENRVAAGLRYDLFEKTTLMLDYYYQDDEIIEVGEETPPGSDIWVFSQIENDAYNVFDLGVRQVLFENRGYLNDLVLSVFVKNLFDEDYSETGTYPATDRTYGASLSMSF